MNPYLSRLEHKLHEELNLVLFQEELSWFQKSRAQWLNDGDKNTRFYHLKVLNRRRRNKIIMLRNDEGEWIEDESKLREMVNSFYKNLFTEDNHTSEWVQTKFTYPTIDECHIESMGRPIGKKR